MRAITGIIVHHSAGDPSATVESVRRAHKAQGWRDIGYHLIVRLDPLSGWVVEGGRPVAEAGAHDAGQNRGTIGVCIFGDYSTDPVPVGGWLLLIGLLAGLLLQYKLKLRALEGHQENEGPGDGTLCPGFDSHTLRINVGCVINIVSSSDIFREEPYGL